MLMVPFLVVMWFEAYVYSCLLPGIVGLNPTRGMNVCPLCMLYIVRWSSLQYLQIFTITTNSLVNSFIYMVTSFYPKLGSSSGHNTGT